MGKYLFLLCCFFSCVANAAGIQIPAHFFSKNHYDVLNISENANDDEIKAAVELAMQEVSAALSDYNALGEYDFQATSKLKEATQKIVEANRVLLNHNDRAVFDYFGPGMGLVGARTFSNMDVIPDGVVSATQLRILLVESTKHKTTGLLNLLMRPKAYRAAMQLASSDPALLLALEGMSSDKKEAEIVLERVVKILKRLQQEYVLASQGNPIARPVTMIEEDVLFTMKLLVLQYLRVGLSPLQLFKLRNLCLVGSLGVSAVTVLPGFIYHNTWLMILGLGGTSVLEAIMRRVLSSDALNIFERKNFQKKILDEMNNTVSTKLWKSVRFGKFSIPDQQALCDAILKR